MKRAVAIGAGLLVLALAGLGVVVGPRLERGPSFEPWIDPLPEHAVSEGYWSFKSTEGGWAVRGYADWWMERVPPDPSGPVISDRRHASKQPEEDFLGLEEYGYTRMHGLHRAFEPLREVGADPVPVYDPITPGVLAGASMVFINLVSGDNPGFRHSEVLALESFVRHGGGLVLITDHTNCYFSAEMVQPLSQALGFEVVPATACELPPRTLSPGSRAWAVMTVPGEHPVAEGVERVGWMNGGILEPGPEFVPVMSSSETGWRDWMDPYKKHDSSGFTGNLSQDEGEPQGPHAVIIAGQVGQGRVVVLADQNAWGSTLLGYEDNARVFTNALQWARGGDTLPLDLRGPSSVTTLGGPRSLCTSASLFGFRTLQVQSQRFSEHTGAPEFCTADRPVSAKRLLVLPEAERADLRQLLESGERAVVLVDAEHPEHLQTLGLSLAETQDPRRSSWVQWQSDAPRRDHKVFSGAPAQEPLEVSPLVLEQDLSPLLLDDLGRPVIVQHQVGASEVWLVLDASLLTNDVLGGERDDPTRPRSSQRAPDKAPTVPDDQRASGMRTAWRLVDFLYP